MKKYFSNYLLFFVLLILLGVLIHIRFANKYQNENKQLIFLKKPLNLNITNLDLQSQTKSKLLIMFTLNDCPLCLFEAQNWGIAAEKLKDNVDFIGVTKDDTTNNKISDFIDEYKLNFVIYRNRKIFNELKTLLSSNGYNYNTPLKLFINKNCKIMAIEKGTKNLEKQKMFVNRVRSIFNEY